MQLGRNQFSSDIPLLLKTLKKLLKVQGLRYQDVSDALNVSKITVKRYLSGRGLTVEALERICSVMGLCLADIIDITRDNKEDFNSMLTLSQEEYLFSEPFLAVLFVLLTRGWSPSQLQEEFEISDIDMDMYLIKMDKIKLIELHPFKRIKLLIRRPFKVRQGGPLHQAFNKYMKDDLYKNNMFSDDRTFRFTYYKFSAVSIQSLAKMADDLLRAAEQLSESDRNLPKGATTWQSLFILMSPTDLARVR